MSIKYKKERCTLHLVHYNIRGEWGWNEKNHRGRVKCKMYNLMQCRMHAFWVQANSMHSLRSWQLCILKNFWFSFARLVLHSSALVLHSCALVLQSSVLVLDSCALVIHSCVLFFHSSILVLHSCALVLHPSALVLHSSVLQVRTSFALFCSCYAFFCTSRCKSLHNAQSTSQGNF